MHEITVERIRETKILWFCKSLIPLGLDWFENPDSGQSYLLGYTKKGLLRVKATRFSRKILRYSGDNKQYFCQRCGKMCIVINRWTSNKWCADCAKKIKYDYVNNYNKEKKNAKC